MLPGWESMFGFSVRCGQSNNPRLVAAVLHNFVSKCQGCVSLNLHLGVLMTPTCRKYRPRVYSEYMYLVLSEVHHQEYLAL